MPGIRRREFITLLGSGATAWPFVANAQHEGRIRHVVVWIGGSSNDPTSQQRGATFRDTMRGLGWIEGRNIKIDVRFPTTNTAEETRAAAAELAALNPDVIVTTGAPILGALHRVTKTVPLVLRPLCRASGSYDSDAAVSLRARLLLARSGSARIAGGETIRKFQARSI
jgi:putative ABC transport system substrate-binding protein